MLARIGMQGRENRLSKDGEKGHGVFGKILIMWPCQCIIYKLCVEDMR